LASNDKNVNRNGDQIDVAPTIYYGLGMWEQSFTPQLDGYPLQVSLPEEVEQARQKILNDMTQPPIATISNPTSGASLAANANIVFNASDTSLIAVLLLIDNTLIADSSWTWQTKDAVEVNGSYTWDTNVVSSGSHTITILSFDEHGSNNSPSTATITVNRASQPAPTQISITQSPTQTPKTSPKNTPTSTPKPTDEPIPTPLLLSTPLPTNSQSLLLGEQTYYGIIITIVTILVVLALTVILKKRPRK